MIVNIGTRVETVNIALFTSRNATLIERKMLQYATICKRIHNCTRSELKTQVFTLSDVFVCLSIHCASQKQHSNHDLLTKSDNITFQTCINIAFEYLRCKIRAQA